MSNNDYYEILELKRNCSQEEIAEAFRRLSLKYNPKNVSQDKAAITEYQFHKIAEAYEVLSDPNKKGIFDIYGKEGLKNGIIDKYGNLKGAYKYAGNGQEIFQKFMGTLNPYAVLKDADKMDDNFGSAFSSGYGGKNSSTNLKLKPVNVDLICTLEELYKGTVKKLIYKIDGINPDMRTTSEKECIIDVEILPGYDKNTIITLKGKGNQAPGLDNSDLLIHIKEAKNEFFKRINGNDLVYIKKLTLSQALNSEPVKITTLDGRYICVTMDEIISPQTEKIVKGEGMPIINKNNDKKNAKNGDLYIRFDIIFPEYIEPDKKERITMLLEGE